ncbi:FAS1-like dehydratase domain-containing protein [Acidipropionibacterium virtanenii]|uniref:UPF0336 protein JS278_00915 n=1 Tax=Acidipropionibacterium virtanenii TaxID=2057246 RepID=A0A344US51_9ACTN|nr:MaoC family dehydratase N-terminal domain-containing protein [Acidipropionibacterium virtanenii]AXE38099.1 hypothetical protein JS278_00915 [Acidipropionibacterium virtanenii]
MPPTSEQTPGLSAEHVGRRYPATEPYIVSAAKISEFATALADDSSAYRGPDPVAPPTFAMVIAAQAWSQLFDDADLGLRLDHTIHADQSFEWVRPLRAGDAVTATLEITSVRNRRGTDIIGLEVSLDAPDGEHLATATSTLWHTGEDAA